MVAPPLIECSKHVNNCLFTTYKPFNMNTNLHTSSCFSEASWQDEPLTALLDLLPCNHVKVPGIGGPTGGYPASPQMARRSEQAVRMVPLAAYTDSHTQRRRLLLSVLTARKAQLPLGVRSDRLIIVTHVVAVRRCSLACGLQVHTTLDVVMFYLGCHTSSWVQRLWGWSANFKNKQVYDANRLV